MKHNFDISVEDFNLSIHLSPYPERYGFFAFLWSLKEEGGGSLVDFEDQYHKLGRNLKYTPLGCHDDEHEAVDQLSYECLTYSFSIFPAVLLLLPYLQIHKAIPCLFFLLIHCDNDEVSF